MGPHSLRVSPPLFERSIGTPPGLIRLGLESSDLLEISASGERLPMSAAAQEALLKQPSKRHAETSA